jgi:hypothetical protein
VAGTVTTIGGPALFFVGRFLLAAIPFSHLEKTCVIGLLSPGCLVPPTLLLPPLVIAIAVGAVLTGVAISDNLQVSRKPRRVAPPAQRQLTEPSSPDPNEHRGGIVVAGHQGLVQ